MKKKKANKTATLQIRVNDDQYNAILEEAEKVGLSLSSYVRYHLLQYIEEKSNKGDKGKDDE